MSKRIKQEPSGFKGRYPRYFTPKPRARESGFYAPDFLFFRIDDRDTVVTVYEGRFYVFWETSISFPKKAEEDFLSSEHVYRCVEISEQEAALI